MIEKERSYVFTPQSIPHISKAIGMTIDSQSQYIIDNYLNPNLRIRHTNTDNIVLTRKSSNDSTEGRLEENHPIDKETASLLERDTKLQIIKARHSIGTPNNNVAVTLDIFESPMKIVVLEIESVDGQTPPTSKQLFDIELTQCPLNAWKFFKRKIGICGAPSSGKTEMAKSLSHILNVDFCANTFHVLEYATSFIQKYERHPDSMDQFLLWHSQKAREDNAAKRADIIISDSPTFLSYLYMLFHNHRLMEEQFRIHLAKLYKRILEDMIGYQQIIYLRPQPVVQNNIRFHTDSEILEISQRIYAFLTWHNVPHIIADKNDPSKVVRQLFYLNDISGDSRGQLWKR